ncbi:MAG: hypothetical protein ACTTKP_08020 [Catonella sp.]|uniref:hypothetical protein n=1 Tax=Catonella sp. TaxID=2382125 RepID=UPI003FA1863E
MFNGFTGAVTGAISGGIDNAKKLGEGAKLVAEAVSGFIIGTGEDAARQAFVEGKKEVNLGQSVMKGIKNAALAVAVPLIIKGGKAVVNKIKTPGVNTVAGKVAEDVIGKGFKKTSEDVIEEVAEKGTKTLVNNVDDVISDGVGKAKFGSLEKLEGHFEKHGKEFKWMYNTADDYLDGAIDVMNNGYKVQYQYKGEIRTGYTRFMENSSKKGLSKFEFVGTNSIGEITTYHVESGKDFWKMLNGKNIKEINPID